MQIASVQTERVLILTHRREILKNTSLELSGGDFEHGLIQAGLNLDVEAPVQIASVQTLWARCMRTNKVPLPAADLLIIDETHHVAARTWRKIIEAYPNARLIGLMATPCRSDGRGLGNYFTKIIEGPQIPELIAQKFRPWSFASTLRIRFTSKTSSSSPASRPSTLTARHPSQTATPRSPAWRLAKPN